MSDRRTLLLGIAQVLRTDVSASTSDIAAAVGIGRSTLHRSFGPREAMLRSVAEFVVAETDRLARQIGLRDAPPADVLAMLGDVLQEWALLCDLMWSGTALSADVDLRGAYDDFDRELAQFAKRAQADGTLRADAPAAWISYSIGAVAMAAGYAIDAGHITPRAAKELFLSSLLHGIGTPASAAMLDT